MAMTKEEIANMRKEAERRAKTEVNQIDYDNRMLEKIKNDDQFSLDENKQNKEYKISMFDKLNKFKQYDSLEIKNNRKILNS